MGVMGVMGFAPSLLAGCWVLGSVRAALQVCNNTHLAG
jgi:hypothetical protein